MNVAMNIVSMIQVPNDVYIDQVPFFGTEREAYEAIKITAMRLAKDIEYDAVVCTVEMQDDLEALIWAKNQIIAKVEATYDEVSL